MFLIKFFKEKIDKDIDEPKYLNEAVLKFPGSTISSLIKETKYLYKNAIFEIVAHGLNIHREDVISDLKIKKIIKKSNIDMLVDVDDLYYKKFKTIYGEILRYATTAQNDLKLTKIQNNSITDIKIANRKMVEIIKDVKELNKNLTMSLTLDNKNLLSEYNGFRKKVTNVLRVIYRFRTEEKSDKYAAKLEVLKTKAKENKCPLIAHSIERKMFFTHALIPYVIVSLWYVLHVQIFILITNNHCSHLTSGLRV